MKDDSAALNDPLHCLSDHPGPSRSAARWIKRFLDCNPFYLISAALLLYGFYLVSVDPNFLRQEISQLFFNFTALQFYEALLVITAIFLVRKRIWYDSTLLVGVENLLVLVPFILISQAALIEIRWVWAMCLVAGAAVVVRSSALKRFVSELNFPTRLIQIGLVVLVVNVLLPLTYRILHEFKIGKLPTTGAAYLTNEFAWLLLLPMLCALANFVPARSANGNLLPQRFWIPPGLFSLWVIGTIVHLYCLGYVYDFALRGELVAPTAWVLVWVLYHRLKEFVPGLNRLWERSLIVLPLAATLIGVSEPGNEVFLFLTILNVAIYGRLSVLRTDRFTRHLLLISLLALIAGLPDDWACNLIPEFTRAKCIAASTAIYFVLLAAFSRNPKVGLLGALMVGLTVMSVLASHSGLHWGIQSALAFLLVQSLRWTDNQHEGTGAVRLLASIGWVAHTFWWIQDGGAFWMACAVSVPVLGIYFVARWLGGKWGSVLVPISAGIVLLSGPGSSGAGSLHSTPSGLLAVIGSFLLFGVGTCAALTKRRWLH
ncbi:MAG TPA: hypothetical protein VL361_17705 [Candidatus Limnocylindrales bacterium]|jgi:hypothetical protein|nr:hypothetical protein [Candidatus Limnocylindrales bacterium]